MNKKSLFGLFLFSILLASLILSANLALAQEDSVALAKLEAGRAASQLPGATPESIAIAKLEAGRAASLADASSSSWIDNFRRLAFVDLWLGGYKSGHFEIAGTFVKVMLLLLMIILVQCALNYVKFPENTFAQVLISIIVGILATFLVSTEALLTSLTSFTALGTAIWIFLPILILTFFTIMVSASAAPFGILIQKILWLIYSVYTFISGLVIFSLAQSKAGSEIAGSLTKYIINPLYGADSVVLEGMKSNADAPTAVLLVVVSIFVFVIAVVKGDFLTHWLAKEKMDADLMKFQGDVERQSAKRRIEAEDTKSKKE
jgi:hypothetical protein